MIVEKILETLHDKKLLTGQLLKILITEKLKTLRLSWIPEKNRNDPIFHEILQQVSTSCPVITIECFHFQLNFHLICSLIF